MIQRTEESRTQVEMEGVQVEWSEGEENVYRHEDYPALETQYRIADDVESPF
jgi:hypothetical protein